jgi:hypothetical protein
LAPGGVGAAVVGLGVGQLAPQPVELTELVVRHPDRRVRWFGEPFARPLGLGHRLSPLAAHLQDLRPVHEALTPVRHETGLRRAPPVERGGPLPGTAQVEGLLTGVDDGAVHDSRHDRRGLAGGDRHHRLVEQAHAVRRAARPQERLAPTDRPESGQVPVAEALRQLAGFAEALERAVEVAARDGHQGLGEQQVPPFHAVEPVLVHEGPRTGQPAAPWAISPRWTRPKPAQNAHRTACSGADRSSQAWWARVHASVLSPSRPVRYEATASRSRSSGSSGVTPATAAALSCSYASGHSRRSKARRP